MNTAQVRKLIGSARWKDLLGRYVVIVALVILVAFTALMNPVFLKPENLFNILRQVSFVGVISVGMTFVIVGGGIDLSVGSMLAFLGGATILILNGFIGAASASGDPFLRHEVLAVIGASLCCLLMGPILGLLNGVAIAKGKISPFIATLGGMAIYRSLALLLADGGEYRSQSFNIYGHVGMESFGPVPYPVVIWLIIGVIGHVMLARTRYGRHVYAIGCNEQAARYSGINIDRVKMCTYAIAGACTGISALLLSSRMNSVSSSGTGYQYELDAIAAVIIGGTKMKGGSGTIWGTLVGVIILGIINNMLNLLDVSVYLQGTVKGFIIVGAVLMQRKETGE